MKGKLASRKLWVTVLTLVIVVVGELTGADLTEVQTAAVAAIGAAYVLAQAVVDAVRAERGPETPAREIGLGR